MAIQKVQYRWIVCNCPNATAKTSHECVGHPPIKRMECDEFAAVLGHTCKGHPPLAKGQTIAGYKKIEKHLLDLGSRGVPVDMRPIRHLLTAYPKGSRIELSETTVETAKRANDFREENAHAFAAQTPRDNTFPPAKPLDRQFAEVVSPREVPKAKGGDSKRVKTEKSANDASTSSGSTRSTPEPLPTTTAPADNEMPFSTAQMQFLAGSIGALLDERLAKIVGPSAQRKRGRSRSAAPRRRTTSIDRERELHD